MCPLSVSVCSNVPGYQETKCFVSDGDPNVFITVFIQYLTKISLKSSPLLREQFTPVFEALKQAAAPNLCETHEDQTLANSSSLRPGTKGFACGKWFIGYNFGMDDGAESEFWHT